MGDKLYFNVDKKDLEIGEEVSINDDLKNYYTIKEKFKDYITLVETDEKVKYEDVFLFTEV